jgi:hypothetical protein
MYGQQAAAAEKQMTSNLPSRNLGGVSKGEARRGTEWLCDYLLENIGQLQKQVAALGDALGSVTVNAGGDAPAVGHPDVLVCSVNERIGTAVMQIQTLTSMLARIQSTLAL